ncbi:sulfite exporter TauE/SafE family protein [Candidatus Woesearchaeota archaeon]|nr:sulfite exporter TauE/SafE family protein [Candidatus Woesearchaeota archaeon]
MAIFELALAAGLLVTILAFFGEFIDSTLGMGYGTTLTPVLMIFGFEPLQIVPTVLLSELITGLLAGFTHHFVGNVDFRPRTMNLSRIFAAFKKYGIKESWEKGVPLPLKVALVLALCSIVGTVAAVFIAISLPKLYLKLYIGMLVLVIGIVILATMHKQYGFSWKKITALGTIAAFNKGMSGGGYGPVVTGGQLLSGVNGKNAIGITSLAEGLTCVVGVIVFVITGAAADWTLAPYLIIGAVASVPLSALCVKKMNINNLKIVIGIATVALGLFTLGKVLWPLIHFIL